MSKQIEHSGVVLPLFINRRAFLVQSAAVAASTLLPSCGGGNNSSTPNPTPTPNPSSQLSITSLSTTTPTALTPLVVTLSGFDPTQPFTASLSDPSGNQMKQIPIRFQSDGTVVLATPLHIDASTGNTSSFSTTLTITQGSSSVNTPIVINDMPQLSDLGVPLGIISRAFFVHQAISLGQSINAQQAIALLSTAGSNNGALLANLQAQLLNVIRARNDIDRIVTDNTVSIPIGSAPDGTAISFDVNSVAMLDRILAQYLVAWTNNGTVLPQIVKSQHRHGRRLAIAKQLAGLPQGLITTIVQAISGASGSVSYLNNQQTQTSSSSSTLDSVLSSLSFYNSIITVGAGAIALGAATVAGAPVIAAAAGAVATYSALAGVLIGSASMGNDLYNVVTNGYAVVTNQPGASVSEYQKAVSSLTSDTITTLLNAEGVGGLTNSAEIVGPAASSVFRGIFEPTAADAALGAGGLVTSVANLVVQSVLTNDGDTAQSNTQSVQPSSFGLVDGTVSVSNSEGPILSGLSGIGAGNNGSLPDALTSIAAPDGTYSLLLPIGSPSLAYNDLDVVAFDPVDLYDPSINTITVLSSSVVDLSGANPSAPITGPSLVGTCNDTDAGDPDGDDPDCD